MKILFKDGIQENISISYNAEIARVERELVRCCAMKEDLPPLITVKDSCGIDRYIKTKDILMITYDDDHRKG